MRSVNFALSITDFFVQIKVMCIFFTFFSQLYQRILKPTHQGLAYQSRHRWSCWKGRGCSALDQWALPSWLSLWSLGHILLPTITPVFLDNESDRTLIQSCNTLPRSIYSWPERIYFTSQILFQTNTSYYLSVDLLHYQPLTKKSSGSQTLFWVQWRSFVCGETISVLLITFRKQRWPEINFGNIHDSYS